MTNYLIFITEDKRLITFDSPSTWTALLKPSTVTKLRLKINNNTHTHKYTVIRENSFCLLLHDNTSMSMNVPSPKHHRDS